MLIFYGNGIGLLNLDNVIKFEMEETSSSVGGKYVTLKAICTDGSSVAVETYNSVDDAKIELAGIIHKYSIGAKNNCTVDNRVYEVGKLKSSGSRSSDLTSLFK